MQSSGVERVLADVCGRIAQEIGDGTTAEKLQRFRAYLHMLSNGERCAPSKHFKPAFYGAFLAAAALGAAIFIYYPQDWGFKFWIGTEEAAVASGQRVSATDREVPITFEQGSNFIVQKGSVAEVLENRQDSVRFNLEDGEVRAQVVGNNKTKWSVGAGPFNVVVVGTQFSVAWDRNAEDLDVRVEKGTVLVEGARYAENGIKVSQGYHLKMNQRTNAFALHTADTIDDASDDASGQTPDSLRQSEPFASNVSVGPVSKLSLAPEQYLKYAAFSVKMEDTLKGKGRGSAPEGRYRTGSGRIRRAVSTGARRPRAHDENHSEPPLDLDSTLDSAEDSMSESQWLQYYEQGDYAAALKAAELIGIDMLVEQSDLEALWKLMHAARNEGRTHIAEQALTACRQRFSQSKKARLAAFILGKIYYENKQDMDSAVRWFTDYLSESPGGQLAEEAEGRVMTALAMRGRRADAERAAKEYLRKYPKGIFSSTAKSLTGR